MKQALTVEQSAYLIKRGVSAKKNREIIQFDLRGNEISRHIGIMSAAKSINACYQGVWKCCQGSTTQYKGYIWLYAYNADRLPDYIQANSRVIEILPNEEWRDVVGFEGVYKVSNFGRVMSVERVVPCGCKNKVFKAQLLTPQKFVRKNYAPRLYVHFNVNGRTKNFYIHRLVAEAFIPNPNNLPQVNHKDENPMNNHVDNLEWCTVLYNLSYKDGYARRSETRKRTYKRVLQLDNDGNVVKEWESAIAAARGIGCALGSVSRVINGFRKSTRGYKFVWKDDYIDHNHVKLD